MLDWLRAQLGGGAGDGVEAANRLIKEGYGLHQAGELARAETLYRAALQRSPDHADALYLLSGLRHRQGDAQEAVALAERAVRAAPRIAAMHAHLAGLCRLAGRLEAAEAGFREALRLEEANAAWWNDLGTVLQERARDGDALACYERALVIEPKLVQAEYNAGIVLKRQGLYQRAAASFERARALKPDAEDIHVHLGQAQRGLGLVEQARASFRRALELNARSAPALNGMGMLAMEAGNTGEALSHFGKALELDPRDADAYNNRGAALAGAWRVREALADDRRALEIRPDHAGACNNLAAILGDLAEFDETYALLLRALAKQPDYAEAQSNYLYTLNYDPVRSREEVFSAYSDWGRKAAAARRDPRGGWDGRRRLRVGYVSPDFRGHSARHFIEPILAKHDKSGFEVYCYAEVRAPDRQTEVFRSQAEHWCATVGMSDDELADRVAADGIDVLVDLAGHTLGNRLGVFARKPAPVQVTYIGYGYTTGLASIDYFLADRHFVPEDARRFYSEKIWYLDRIPFSYRPAAEMPAVGELPASGTGAVTFGCFSRAIRVNHRVVRLWSEILKAVPGSRLLLNTFVFTDPWVRDQFRSRFAAHGVNGDRIELVATRPISATWDAYNRVDITLDPFPHNAGTTLFESLWMGVPVVSLRGTISLGRFGDTILSAVGLDAWVADSEERYLAIAVERAKDLAALAGVRRGLRERMRASPICDEAGYARALEDAYRGMARAAPR